MASWPPGRDECADDIGWWSPLRLSDHPPIIYAAARPTSPDGSARGLDDLKGVGERDTWLTGQIAGQARDRLRRDDPGAEWLRRAGGPGRGHREGDGDQVASGRVEGVLTPSPAAVCSAATLPRASPSCTTDPQGALSTCQSWCQVSDTPGPSVRIERRHSFRSGMCSPRGVLTTLIGRLDEQHDWRPRNDDVLTRDSGSTHWLGQRFMAMNPTVGSVTSLTSSRATYQ